MLVESSVLNVVNTGHWLDFHVKLKWDVKVLLYAIIVVFSQSTLSKLILLKGNQPNTSTSSLLSGSSRPQTPSPLSEELTPPTTMPQTPPPRRSPPPRTPDSTGLTPSSRRATARRRVSVHPHTSSPPSPTLTVSTLRRSVRTIQPRHFYGDTPTPSPPQTKLCTRHNHWKPLADYVDTLTREEYNTCKDCRCEVAEITRERMAEIQANIEAQQEEFERIMNQYGNFQLNR
jgi:hypothetical protein